MSTHHEHGLWLWQVLPLVNLDVSLGRDKTIKGHIKKECFLALEVKQKEKVIP